MPGDTLITGGSGFLGTAVARAILCRDPSRGVVLADLVRSPRLGTLVDRVVFAEADLADPACCQQLVTPDVRVIYHFASLVSGGAESDFVGGYRANLYATLNLLEACRKGACAPRFVFTSSIATFGGSDLPETVNDWTFQHPQNSYGVAKVIGEQLLNDYSRKGYIDGRGVRLPAIVVRDEANTAASGYVSALVREPVAGRDYVCPVPAETRIPILSVDRCVQVLVTLGELAEGRLGDYRTINGPSISPSAQEIADAVQRAGMRNLGRISFKLDAEITRMIQAWPERMAHDHAAALKIAPDDGIESIVQDYTRKLGTR